MWLIYLQYVLDLNYSATFVYRITLAVMLLVGYTKFAFMNKHNLMKRYNKLGWLSVILVVTLLFTGCKKDEVKTIPSISTLSVTNYKGITATSGGRITDDGGSPIMEQGICWGKSSTPTIADSVTKCSSGGEEYTCELRNLEPNSTYYVRAYAINAIGIAYGYSSQVKTVELSVSSIAGITSISNTSVACCYGYYEATGKEYGLCWSTSANPTVADSYRSITKGEDLRWIVVEGLANNTTYHIRGYTRQDGAVVYGKDTTFTTRNWEIGSVTDIDNNTYKTIKIGNQVWMQENLRVTHYRNGDPIPNLVDDKEWAVTTVGAYSWCLNDKATYEKNGALYNGYAVLDSRGICPVGWHVATYEDYKTLFDFCGGLNRNSIDKLMEACYSQGYNNETGFTCLYGYHRSCNGSFWCYPQFWTSTFEDSMLLSTIIPSNFDTYYTRYTQLGYGFGVRCVKD